MGFAAFAVGASLLGIRKAKGIATWWTLVIIFALTGPVGLAMGAIFRSSFEDAVPAAFLQCLAAGTLLAVGITDMVMPALEDIGVWKKRKLVAAFLGFFCMG